jgi:signal peptidase II
VAIRKKVYLAISAGIVLLDQVVKIIVGGRLTELDSVVVIPNLFSLTRVHNTGVAFGTLDTVEFPGKSLLVAGVAVAALIGLALYALALDDDQRLTRLGLALVIGGAAGNLIDRVRLGYVLDFFDFYWGGWHFWAFNVADAAISVGVGVMVLDILLGMKRNRRVSRAV